MKVFLIGPMGSGKTTIGGLLANQLDLPIYEMDHIIEHKTEMTVQDIFQKNGEDYFRHLESKLLEELIKLEEAVVSTGGGIILSPLNRHLIKNESCVIYLKCSPETQLERLKNDNSRPLLNCEDKFKKLRQMKTVRDPLYAEVATYTANTDTLDTETVLQYVLSFLETNCKSLKNT